MDFKESLDNYIRLTLVPAWRRMFGKARSGNTWLLIGTFFLIGTMLSVICLSYHVNLRENERLSAEYEAYISSSTAAIDTETAETAAEALNHILISKLELTSVFLFLMIVWGILSVFSLARIFHATIEQNKYVYGLYVTFGSDTRQIRRQIHTEFSLAALLALSAAIPTATLLTYLVYAENGQTFQPTLAPYLQIFLWLFAVSLIGAGYLSHRITNSTCVELMTAQDCSDYVSSPRASRPLGKRLYNGPLRYARLAILRMRSYYIPLVLTVSLVAAVFFSSMNLALEGERAAAERVHEYSIEFSGGLSSRELSSGYLDHLMDIEDVQSVSAIANGKAELLGTHLLAEKSLFDEGSPISPVDCGNYYATDKINILCADSNTRTELGGDVILPAQWQSYAYAIETRYNYTMIPEAGSVVYMYPEEREAELNVSVGDTLRLALPRGASGATLEEKIANGSYEYLTLTVSEVVEIPGVYYVTPNDAEYVCPRITEDYLLLNPEDYAAVTQSETVERLALDELYREDFRFGIFKSPAVLLLPEDYSGPTLTTIQMFSPTVQVTAPYSVTNPLDSSRSILLDSDIFYLNRTANHTYFYLGTLGEYNNDAEALDQTMRIENNSLYKYKQTELTVIAQISCSDLTAPCVILPNDDFFSSYEGDLCILQLYQSNALFGVREEVFAFGTNQILTRDEYVGSLLFLHTKIKAGFFDEMRSQGLYTTYEKESAYELSSFSVQTMFDVGGYTYFLCRLSPDCNLGLDQYPAYMAPGNDFFFLDGLTGKTDFSLTNADSYLMFPETLRRTDGGIPTAYVGHFSATNDLTVSVADEINVGLLTPDLEIGSLPAGDAVLILGPNSSLAVRPGDYIQMAIQGDFVLNFNDPHTSGLTGSDLLNYLIQSGTQFRYISLCVTDVIAGERDEDVLYLSETDWQRLRRTDSTYQSLDIYLFGDTDLISLIRTTARVNALMGNWQSDTNRVTMTNHHRLWKSVTTGACNYPAIIRVLSVLLILLLPLLWCAPQTMHFHKRREEFSVMRAVGRTSGQLRRMIATECLLITLAAGGFVALLCPFSVFCMQAAVYMLELPFHTTDFDMRAYLFMIFFVMLCSALSFLTASRHLIEKSPKQKKGVDAP